jgi:DNA-binding transcriptional MocR family regulator
VSGRAVAQAAAARGVAVSPGADFDPARHDLARVRLSVSRVERRDIEPGIAALADALREARTGTDAALAAPVV